MTTGRPDPGPNQRTAAVDTNDSAQTSSRSPRTCSLQPVQNRTYPNRTEHSEHRNRSQAANAAEQTRTGSNAATRDLKAVLLITRQPETASGPLSALPKPASDRQNHHETDQNCPKLHATIARSPAKHCISSGFAAGRKKFAPRHAPTIRGRPYPRTANTASNPNIHDLSRKYP